MSENLANPLILSSSYLEPSAINLAKSVIPFTMIEEACKDIKLFPNYKKTPLHALEPLAKNCSTRSILYKDESSRFQLKSFKALGGAYAVLKVCQNILEDKLQTQIPFEKLLQKNLYKNELQNITVTTATDGNHGRSVAWGAQLLNLKAVIFIPHDTNQERKEAIESFGAEVIQISGNYDEAVTLAQEQAKENSWQLISDTSYPGYEETPKYVMAGYGLMCQEVLDQLETGEIPTHIFVPCGVGALAATVALFFYHHFPKNFPKIILVEPFQADCFFQTLKNNKLTKATGNLHTNMAGLACGEASLLAWKVLKPLAHSCLLLGEEYPLKTMKSLHDNFQIISGETGASSLAAALYSCKNEYIRKKLEITENSCILTLGTEGDTAPILYKKIIES